MEIVKKFSVIIIATTLFSCSVSTFGAKGKDGEPGKAAGVAKNSADGKDGANAEFHLINLKLKKEKTPVEEDTLTNKKAEGF